MDENTKNTQQVEVAITKIVVFGLFASISVMSISCAVSDGTSYQEGYEKGYYKGAKDIKELMIKDMETP